MKIINDLPSTAELVFGLMIVLSRKILDFQNINRTICLSQINLLKNLQFYSF